MNVTTDTVNQIYQYTTYRANERCGKTVTVPGLRGEAHTFSAERLKESICRYFRP